MSKVIGIVDKYAISFYYVGYVWRRGRRLKDEIDAVDINIVLIEINFIMIVQKI